MKDRIGNNEFIALVASLMALVSMVINMLLPAFQSISDSFQIQDKNQVHLCISLLYLGLGISQIFYGVLSDAVGRKPTVYAGLILFILGCAVSFKSNSLFTLLIGQIIQGIGLGAPRVMSTAITRDKFEGKQMAKILSFILVFYSVSPIVSPLLGQFVIAKFSWRILFSFYALMGLVIFLFCYFRLPETLIEEKRKPFNLKNVSTAIIQILYNRKALAYIIVLGLYSGLFITYLNLSQSILEFQYQLGNQYPYYFAFLVLSIGLASFTNGKIVQRVGMEKITKKAIVNSILFSLLFIVINWFVVASLWIFMIFMFAQLFGYGLLIGNLSAIIMQPLGKIAGLAASIIGLMSTLISVPISIIAGSFYNHSSMPIAYGYLVIGTISFLILTNKSLNRYEGKNSKQLV